MINTSLKYRTYNIIGVLFLGLLNLQAQIAKPGYEDKLLFQGITGFSFGGTQMLWELKGYKKISQQAAPLFLSVPLSNRILFTAANYAAISTSDTVKVQGIADTRLSLSYVLPGDKFWLTTGVSLPTGKTGLGEGEIGMMSIMSQNVFGYKVPIFGQGLNVNMGLAYATSITRRFVLGVGTSYISKGTYEPFWTGDIKYKPGDEITTNVGFDYITYSKTSRMSGDFSASYFLDDKLDEVKKFQSGLRFIFLGIYSLKTEAINHQFRLRLRYRLENTAFNDTASVNYDAGAQFEAQYSLTYPLNNWLTGVGITEFKSYSGDQFHNGESVVETGKAQIVSFGTDFLFLVSDIITPTFSLRYSSGNFTIEDEKYDVAGYEVGIGLKVSF